MPYAALPRARDNGAIVIACVSMRVCERDGCTNVVSFLRLRRSTGSRRRRITRAGRPASITIEVCWILFYTFYTREFLRYFSDKKRLRTLPGQKNDTSALTESHSASTTTPQSRPAGHAAQPARLLDQLRHVLEPDQPLPAPRLLQPVGLYESPSSLLKRALLQKVPPIRYEDMSGRTFRFGSVIACE